ncbi:PDZ domain-containing protein GIPC2-like [Terrapene carolina triunguis]|uniref:PDZ domain-containing protein GIPC2-like n=1 Tax=Terrapene triunguis TaxID=2587831 RepID=UPI000E774445|nr:PDZ domain-containing protein GIPC2-like [Terrapene carolina triunguis]
MPLRLRGKKKGKSKETSKLVESEEAAAARGGGDAAAAPPPPAQPGARLLFHTQLAHGSPTGRVGGFASVRELYEQIGQAFRIPAAEQRIKEDSLVDQIKAICVGDHIESINGKNLVGYRHYEVANLLKGLEKGQTFKLTLIEPMKAFEMIEPRLKSGTLSEAKISKGRETLRLRSKGPAIVEKVPSEIEEKAIKKVDDLLETYMGIRDIELAATMVEAGRDKNNPDEFAVALDEALGDFAFPDEFVFDVWGAIGDAKQGRF